MESVEWREIPNQYYAAIKIAVTGEVHGSESYDYNIMTKTVYVPELGLHSPEFVLFTLSLQTMSLPVVSG
jgi:hypothetical protein